MHTSGYAFLFDMDGVIVDSNPFHKIALKQFCKKHDHELSDEQLEKKIYGRTNKDWIPMIFGNISSENVREYADEKEALFREIYKNNIKPVDGLIEFLEQLNKAGIPRALATSAPGANVEFTLLKTKTQKYFETILDESCVNHGKPNPEIYLKAAAALGLDPQNCVVIEDSLAGVKAGKAAGCKVVAFTTTHAAEELSEADLVVNDFVGLNPESVIHSLFNPLNA